MTILNDTELPRRDNESPSPGPANWQDDMEEVNDSDEWETPDCDAVVPEPFTFFINPQNGQAYHFCSTQYTAAATKPGIQATEDGEIAKPKMLYLDWPSLIKARFDNVNSVLRNPYNRDQTFFFFHVFYALVETKSTSPKDFRLLGEGRRFVQDDWRSMRDANFIDMDTFLPCPGNNQEAYVFSNGMYILIHIGPEPNSDRLISGPAKIEDDWRSFKEVGFTEILEILPDTDNQDQAYFFSESAGYNAGRLSYMLVKGIASGPNNVEIVDGPKPVHGNWSLPLVGSAITI